MVLCARISSNQCLPGDTIGVEYKVDNRSTQSVDSIDLCLRQEIRIRAHSHSSNLTYNVSQDRRFPDMEGMTSEQRDRARDSGESISTTSSCSLPVPLSPSGGAEGTSRTLMPSVQSRTGRKYILQ